MGLDGLLGLETLSGGLVSPLCFMLVQLHFDYHSQYHRLPLGWVIRIRPFGIDQMALRTASSLHAARRISFS